MNPLFRRQQLLDEVLVLESRAALYKSFADRCRAGLAKAGQAEEWERKYELALKEVRAMREHARLLESGRV